MYKLQKKKNKYSYYNELESSQETSHETVYTTLDHSTSIFTNYKLSNTLEYSSMAPTTLTINHYQTNSGIVLLFRCTYV